jgi:hypothetical protein
MKPKKLEGQYRTIPDGDQTSMVYVWGGTRSSYVTEAVYRANGYSPDFEILPTEEEYDARRS